METRNELLGLLCIWRPLSWALLFVECFLQSRLSIHCGDPKGWKFRLRLLVLSP